MPSLKRIKTEASAHSAIINMETEREKGMVMDGAVESKEPKLFI
jgi:hypothetical protein